MSPILYNTHADRDSILDQAGQDILRAVELDWRKMCGNEIEPLPQGLNPMRMDLALPHTFIAQRTAPGATRVRVAGQRLHEMLQFDPRGMPFGCFFAESARDTVMELFDAALTLPAIVRIPLTASRGFGRKPVRAEALLLPMRDAVGTLNRIMGVIVAEKPLSPKAHHWDIDAARELMCDIQDGHFPDRRTGPRARTVEATATQTTPTGPRLVVDNTRRRQSASM